MKKIRIRRILASGLDYYICFYIFYIPGKMLEKTAISENLILSIILSLLLVFFIGASFSLKDCLYKNQSIGKKIFGLSVYYEKDNEIPNNHILIKRNLISLFTGGLNVFTIMLSGKSISDYIYKTKVEILKKKTTL